MPAVLPEWRWGDNNCKGLGALRSTGMNRCATQPALIKGDDTGQPMLMLMLVLLQRSGHVQTHTKYSRRVENDAYVDGYGMNLNINVCCIVNKMNEFYILVP